MDIETLSCSRLRRDAIIRLLDGPGRLADIAPGTGSVNSSRAMRPFVSEGLVETEGGLYKITPLGRIHARILRDHLASLEVLESPFWHEHNITSIPEDFMARIGALVGGSEVRENGDMMNAQHSFVETVVNAKEIYGVSSINMPGWPEMITDALRNGAEVHLGLTGRVMGSLHENQQGEWDNAGKIFLSVIADCRAAFTVADSTLMLALFWPSGPLDIAREWVVTSERAREWGMGLFEYYLAR